MRAGISTRLVAAASLAVIALFAGAGALADTSASGGAPAPAPIEVVRGTTIGMAEFPDGDAPDGGHGQPIDDAICDQSGESFHYHTHVSIFINGRQFAVPAAVGIVKPEFEPGEPNFVHTGRCFYDVHTHDGTGIIHVGAAATKSITLGTFFRIWGRPLGPTGIAGFDGPVLTVVNGVRQPPGFDPASVVLAPDMQITIEIGFYVEPPVYAWGHDI